MARYHIPLADHACSCGSLKVLRGTGAHGTQLAMGSLESPQGVQHMRWPSRASAEEVRLLCLELVLCVYGDHILLQLLAFLFKLLHYVMSLLYPPLAFPGKRSAYSR